MFPESGPYSFQKGVARMKLRDVMTCPAIQISAEESVEVAARQLAHYNIGAMPVCDKRGNLCGVVTDRDMVTRCLAANRDPAQTTVRQIMTGQVITADTEMDVGVAAHLMGRKQIRRLPVTDQGRVCGMVSLADLAIREECAPDAADALTDISDNITTA